MNWSSLREEGLFVSLEGEGGELVPYPSLQECQIWFENGEPCHTLYRLFHSSFRPPSPPLSPAAQPWLQNHLVMCWDVDPPSSSSAAGCLPPCLIPGDC
ncbi:hypothetical protein NQZ68_032966 [Dissostichus eleginoides]|nr:hypothetical protein NQZ68_032966 [Dissostichus eleginoides]